MATYEEAFEHVKKGGRARLSNWVDPNAYIYFQEERRHLDGKTRIGTIYARVPMDNRSEQQKYDAPYFPYNKEGQRQDWELFGEAED